MFTGMLQRKSMNKVELIREVANRSDISIKSATEAVNNTLEVIAESIAKHENVELKGFGTFTSNLRAERQGINPRTKEPMVQKASYIPKFKPGTALRKRVNP